MSKMKFGLTGLASILFFYCWGALAANRPLSEGELVISCAGERISSYDPADRFGRELKLEVWQSPERTDYRWILKIAAKVSGEQRTNGPINEDGTTTAPNGDTGIIMYNSPGQGLLIKKANGALHANFSFIETLEGQLVEYYLVEYNLNCELASVRIDQHEANIYNATAGLADSAVMLNKPWLNGVGVSISETGMAVGVAVYAKDKGQADAFVTEFVKRGLVVQKKEDSLFYKYTSAGGEVAEIPLLVEITGDVGPIP